MNVCIAFEVLQDGIAPPPDHQFLCCHMIFDVKMEEFCRKARLVVGGHNMTKAPATITYASIVSCEMVRLAPLIAILNNVDIWTADVLCTYITTPCQDKILITLGREFGAERGHKAIIV